MASTSVNSFSGSTERRLGGRQSYFMSIPRLKGNIIRAICEMAIELARPDSSVGRALGARF